MNEIRHSAAESLCADVFADASAWNAVSSGVATLDLGAARGPRGAALRLDYDFHDAGGFVVARRAWDVRLPEYYALRFRLRGTGRVNRLEIKLVDAAGSSVWRTLREGWQPSRGWSTLRVDGEELVFAWGPRGGGTPGQLGALEIALVAEQGGSGTLWLSGLELLDTRATQPPSLTASSAQAGHAAQQALSMDGWQPRPDDAKPWLELDLHQVRNLGGISIDWPQGAPQRGYTLWASNTGRRYRRIWQTRRAGGHHSALRLPGLSARHLRLQLSAPVPVAGLTMQAPAWGRTPLDFWRAQAARLPRGRLPRWLGGEQCLWTPVGCALSPPRDGWHPALLGADGAVEPDEGAAAIEPMLWMGGQLLDWAAVQAEPALADGWKPFPSVRWRGPGWALEIAADTSVAGLTRVHYRLARNDGRAPDAQLFLLIRPFQVTPAWQSPDSEGGFIALRELAWRDGALYANGRCVLRPARPPLGFGALDGDQGPLTDWLQQGWLPSAASVRDAHGLASGALAFRLSAAAGAVATLTIACPNAATPDAAGFTDPRFDWDAALPLVHSIRAGDAAQAALQTLRSAAAQLLSTRNGAALQPGPRRYARAWIRDGAMMAMAMSRLGRTDVARDFIAWYAPWLRADGHVPCGVTRTGIDPIVEHDSHGQWLSLVADTVRFTGDRALAQAYWDSVQRVAGYIAEIMEPDGLLPVSASHEGYLAQPVHSYWDGFWAVRGMRDAAWLAAWLGQGDSARQWTAQARTLDTALGADIAATRRQRALDFIPGSREWADLDPTATANAVMLLDPLPAVDRAALQRSFDLHLQQWQARQRPDAVWSNYSPYEIRIIGALVRLGRRSDALAMLAATLADRRPTQWNQWPEIAWRDPTAPAHLGDLPHTWIAAEYILAVRSLFVYERDEPAPVGGELVLAAGIDPAWADGEGVVLDGLPTAFGLLAYRLRRDADGSWSFVLQPGLAVVVELRAPVALASVHTLDGAEPQAVSADRVRFPPGGGRWRLWPLVPDGGTSPL